MDNPSIDITVTINNLPSPYRLQISHLLSQHREPFPSFLLHSIDDTNLADHERQFQRSGEEVGAACVHE